MEKFIFLCCDMDGEKYILILKWILLNIEANQMSQETAKLLIGDHCKKANTVLLKVN